MANISLVFFGMLLLLGHQAAGQMERSQALELLAPQLTSLALRALAQSVTRFVAVVAWRFGEGSSLLAVFFWEKWGDVLGVSLEP